MGFLAPLALLPAFAPAAPPFLAPAASPAPTQAPARAEYATVKTDDGVSIQVIFQKPADGCEGKPSLLCVPPFNKPKEEYRSTLIFLASQGIVAMAIDTRGTGGSHQGVDREDLSKRVRAKDPALFAQMHRDVNAAVEYLLGTLKVDPAKLAVLGASVGGSIAVHAAAKNPKIAAVAWLTPGESYLGLPTMAHLKEFGDRPLLLLTAKDEEANGTAQIAEARKGSPKTEKKVYPVMQGHGLNLFLKAGDAPKDIVAWLRKQLGYALPPKPVSPQ